MTGFESRVASMEAAADKALESAVSIFQMSDLTPEAKVRDAAAILDKATTSAAAELEKLKTDMSEATTSAAAKVKTINLPDAADVPLINFAAALIVAESHQQKPGEYLDTFTAAIESGNKILIRAHQITGYAIIGSIADDDQERRAFGSQLTEQMTAAKIALFTDEQKKAASILDQLSGSQNLAGRASAAVRKIRDAKISRDGVIDGHRAGQMAVRF